MLNNTSVENVSKEKTEGLREDYGQYIMTPAEYARLSEFGPHAYELRQGDKALTYYAPGHIYELTAQIEELKQKFLEAHPDMVLVEGMPFINDLGSTQLKARFGAVSERELLHKDGEPAYTAKLAVENNVSVLSPEPPEGENIQHLLDLGFSREEVFAEHVANAIRQFYAQQSIDNLEEYMQPYLDMFAREFGWSDFSFTMEHFRNISGTVWQRERDLSDSEFFREVSDPIPWEDKRVPYGRTNQVAAAWNDYRDAYMVNYIQKQLKTYNRLFVVFGTTHAVRQEPALRKMFDEFK